MDSTQEQQILPQRNKNLSPLPKCWLLVVSRVKSFVKGQDMQTSLAAVDELSKVTKHFLDLAIEEAKKDGRKTVMNRDVKNVVRVKYGVGY